MTSFSLDIDHDQQDDHIVLRVTGEVDVETAGRIVETGRLALTQRPGRPMVVDLGRVTFLDSTGLGALVGLRRVATELNCDLTLRDIPPSVRKILAITSLDSVFAVDGSAEAPAG